MTPIEPEQCVKGFSPAVGGFRTAETGEKGHGRIERRRLIASGEQKRYLDWPYAEQVFKVERHIERVKDGKATHEVSHGVTSLTAEEARALCLSYGTSIAYLLWLDVLRSLLGVTEEATPSAVRDRLRERVNALCPDCAADVYPHLARLLSLPLEADVEAKLATADGQSLKARTFAAVERILECAARQRPLVLVCEDLHWADSTSVELLEQLLALTDRMPVLFVCLMRPQRDRPSWRIGETCRRLYPHRHADLSLAPLSAADSQALVSNLLAVEGLPSALKERIQQQAEGNPFYLEEILRSLMDTGAIARDEATGRWEAMREVAEIALPSTLEGVLLARIDRLQEDTKRILQMASVIGRTFLYRVLAAMAEVEQNLDRHLTTLQREEMIRERCFRRTSSGWVASRGIPFASGSRPGSVEGREPWRPAHVRQDRSGSWGSGGRRADCLASFVVGAPFGQCAWVR